MSCNSVQGDRIFTINPIFHFKNPPPLLDNILCLQAISSVALTGYASLPENDVRGPGNVLQPPMFTFG